MRLMPFRVSDLDEIMLDGIVEPMREVDFLRGKEMI